MALIEIDGLPINSMVDLSMAVARQRSHLIKLWEANTNDVGVLSKVPVWPWCWRCSWPCSFMMFHDVWWSLSLSRTSKTWSGGRTLGALNTLNCKPSENESFHWCPMFNASKSSNSHTVPAFKRNMGMIRSIFCTSPSVFITFHRPSLSFTRKSMGSENHVANHMELHRSTVWLVVWTPLKNNGITIFPVYGKIKNVPNHQWYHDVSWCIMATSSHSMSLQIRHNSFDCLTSQAWCSGK